MNDYYRLCDLTGLFRTGYLIGVTIICFKAAIRSSSGGWVLNKELKVPEPKKGFTMQSDEVLGEIAEVGMRLL